MVASARAGRERVCPDDEPRPCGSTSAPELLASKIRRPPTGDPHQGEVVSKKRLATALPPAPADPTVQNIKRLAEQARAQVVVQVNQALVLTYWRVGKAIKQSVVTEARADYGDATMQKLADKLVLDYGPGFGRRNLFRMVKLYQCFDSVQSVTTLSTQLSWSHLVELLKVDDPTRRSFYAELLQQIVLHRQQQFFVLI